MFCSTILLMLNVPFVLAGCGGGVEVSAEKIVSSTISNSAELTTVKFEMSMSMVMEITGGSDPGKAKMLGNGAGSMDSVNMEMQISMNGNTTFPGSEGDLYFKEDVYFTGGWFYMRLSVPGEEDQWTKGKLPDYAWTSENPLEQQVEFLRTANEVTKLGTENVDGVDCYIIQVTPDIDTLSKWCHYQQGGTDLDIAGMDLSKIFKSYSVKEWISRGTYHLVKAETSASLEIGTQDMGETPESLDMQKVTMSEQVKYYDYGKPVTVQLPPEAQNALEIPWED
jgi:hypothetical protein